MQRRKEKKEEKGMLKKAMNKMRRFSTTPSPKKIL